VSLRHPLGIPSDSDWALSSVLTLNSLISHALLQVPVRPHIETEGSKDRGEGRRLEPRAGTGIPVSVCAINLSVYRAVSIAHTQDSVPSIR